MKIYGMFFICAIFCLLTLASLSSKCLAAEKFVIGVSPSLISTLTVVAENQGFFKSEGLNVELRNVGSGSKGVGEMLENRIDIAESSTFALVSNSFARKDFGILATVAVFGNDNMIVARADRGIRKTADLKGKRIGVIKGAFSEYVLDLMLMEARLPSKQVTILRDDAANLPGRLGSGDLDAVCVFGLWIDKAKQSLTGRTVELFDENIFRVTAVLTAKREKIDHSPELFARLLKAYMQAEEYVRKHPDNARKILTNYFKLDEKNTLKVWKPSLFRVSLDQTLVKDLENMAQWQLDSGMQPSRKVPDYLNFLQYRILERVAPKRVTIIH